MLFLVKIGGCFEDCGYCLQLVWYKIDIECECLMLFDDVFVVVKVVKDKGVFCFCMGVVWKGLKDGDFDYVFDMVCEVKVFGM